jgi:hypothetical protein
MERRGGPQPSMEEDPGTRHQADRGMTKIAEKRKTVDFQGSLDVISIESVFQLLYHTSLSGKLLLLNPPAKATFYFKGGSLVWGTLHTRQKQLGQRLLESNQITREQLAECLTIHSNGNQQARLGAILMEKGFVRENVLLDSLKAQVKDAFFHVLSWNQGTFAFISNISAEEEIAINERIDHLLLKGLVDIDHRASKNQVQ